MRFEPVTFTLKDGRECTLCNATKEHAQGMLDFLLKSSEETDFLLRNPDEVNYTLDDEIEILESKLDDPYSVFIAAIVDGKVAGNCAVYGLSYKRRIRHRSTFAIALLKEYWGLGIGSRMLPLSLKLAKEMRYESIELEVVSVNHRAVHLYQKYGYKIYGEREKALKLDDGRYYTELLMRQDLV